MRSVAEVLREEDDPVRRRRAVLRSVELDQDAREHQDRGGEDDRDDAGHVDLDRDVGRGAADRAPPDLTLGVLHRHTPLRLLHEHHEGDRQDAHQQDDEGGAPPLGREDLGHAGGEPGGDGDEDQQRHAVAHAPLGDLLAQPHDQASACGEGDDHQQDGPQGVVRDDRQVAVQQGAGPSQGDQGGGVEHAQRDGQVARVLGHLGLALSAFTVQRLEVRDDHPQQLHDDRGRDVRHDAQGEDRDLEHGPAREHVHERIESAAGVALGQTHLHIAVVHTWSGDECSQSVDGHNAEGEPDLALQIGCPEDTGNRAEQTSSWRGWMKG